MIIKWLDIAGLFIALIGGVVLALGLRISRNQALRIGVSRMADDRDKKNMQLPHVRDEIKESRFATIGIVLFTFGFLLQIISALLN